MTVRCEMLCPNCKLGEYSSIEALISHLNAPSTCWPSDTQPQALPVPSILNQGGQTHVTGTCHPQSGYVYGIGRNMLDKLENDQFAHWRLINPYYPFTDQGEWELGKFLVENLTQTQIMKFLKLKWFDAPNRARPSFTMKDHLLDWMDLLPSFTPWKVSKLEFKGYKTVHPVELVWRDAQSDPTFANHMTFNPYVANVKNQREYGDYMSANMAWKIQDYLLLGATQVPIILGSDKTPMHPVFVTIGNIDSEVHSKATLRAWRCVAYIPVVKFHVHQEYQSILQTRLWHKCMDLVFANLKVAANDGCFMPDPSRYIHHVFTPLVAHMCDLPEATMIAAVSKNSSPLTMAIQADFGDGILHPPHTGSHTLKLIVGISQNVDFWDLDKFQKAAKAINLSGVHMPYWRDWKFACPSVFLAGEVLHMCHKFFADHPLEWIKEALGDYELDTCFMHRDIQRTIVASIAGAVPPRFVHAICSLNPVHSPQSLQSLVQALSDFHSFKDTIIWAEARKGKKGIKEDFFILKLELLQSFDGTIRKLGTLMQFSADMTERLLITHCKNLFPWTSQQIKDFMEQCVCILNRQESMEIFDLYMLLTSRGASLVNTIHAEDEDVTIASPALSWVSRVLPDEVKSIHGILSRDVLTAFQLNVTPNYKSLSPSDIRMKYALFGFEHALAEFICCSPLSSGENSCWDPKYGRFQVWHKFWLQLHLAFQPRVIMPSRMVQAYPPSDDFPFGNCDTVLVDTTGIDGKTSSNLELPLCLSDPLLYVQLFHFISSPDDHPELAMWTVERTYTQEENGNRCRKGAVIRVTDVMHAVELIPVYGEAVANSVSSATSLECYDHFFLNNFADKESYHTFSTEFV
ncbi:uncharacterized protein F5891DRAFT_1132660 [Suillus fuscotomentosus]|uniref:DUF6830 domain-containing protein n=1 Tax=Suillus fuscotomentosus TaxID=1912939 RepID=A0AAD4HAZ7_9AGAM|nr:uncharacterized protein F5891DRAFT_1132660 [Suillus fuscotomentosus]KAG1885930.1 hypothetical protein F5891DRAFT_1132660 [Suillus fuscotomentosus]